MHNPLDVTKWSHKIFFFFPFCVHLGWFTWNSKEQKAVCKAHNRLEQCKNEVRFLNILHFNHTPHPTIFQIFLCVGVCVYVWSGVRLALDLRQSRMGLGKKWKKLGGSWRASRYKCLSVCLPPVWNQWRRLDLWPFAVVSVGPVLCRPVSLCN